MSTAAPPGLAAPRPDPPVHVLVTGLVLQDDEGLRICPGGHQESLPPQGDGPPLLDWDWDAVHPVESSGDVRWGEFAVTGTWDGSALSVTGEPVALALWDPAPEPVRSARPRGRVGTKRLQQLQLELHGDGREELGVLTSYVDRGRLWVLVVFDDGTVQAAFDTAFGPGAVVVGSAMRPTGA